MSSDRKLLDLDLERFFGRQEKITYDSWQKATQEMDTDYFETEIISETNTYKENRRQKRNASMRRLYAKRKNGR